MNLHEQLSKVQMDLLSERANGQQKDQDKINRLETEENNLQQQIMEEQNREALQVRVEEDVQANGYIMDGLKSGEYTLAELAHTPDDYILQATSVQKWGIELKEKYEEGLKQANNLVIIAQNELLLAGEENLILSRTNHQLEIENADLLKKLKNATDIIEELQVAQSDVEIPEVAPLTAEEQDAQWKADNAKTNNRIKVSRIRNADETGIDTRKSIVTIALTGEEVTTETIYLKGRYIEISAVEAEQLRADYANKKAEIELSIPVIATPEIPFVNEDTRQDEAATDKAPNETDQVDAAGHELAESPSSNQGQVGEAESEVTNKRIHALEQSNLEMQTWIDSIEKRVGKIDGMESYNAA